mmetsp:Transcript_82880/g.238170  ORF Transcript_82880/g.238170 Transcript_82880/m.238170 type:complete len:600 (+) Transcript_82880:40-1839(+)
MTIAMATELGAMQLPTLLTARSCKGAQKDAAALPPSFSPPSALSQFFASLEGLTMEASADASLRDLVDDNLGALHETSQVYLPCATMLSEGVTKKDRYEMLLWIVHTFEVMKFSDAAFFDTVLLLDRYYSTTPQPDVSGPEAQQRLLAAVCIALKVGSRADLQIPLPKLVAYLGRDKVSFKRVIDAELAMLQPLRFCVGTPTSLEFLDSLSTRIVDCDRRCRTLADFLLQVTISDPNLHYRYPHAVLAASALALSLFVTQAPPEAYIALVEDLSLVSDDAKAIISQVVPCCAEVHQHWVKSLAGGDSSPGHGYLQQVRAKFSRPTHYAVSLMPPPASPPLCLPPRRDVHEALSAVQESLDVQDKSEGPQRSLDGAFREARFEDSMDALLQRMGGHRIITMDSSSMPKWCSELAAKLQGPADSSMKVRRILAMHSWDAGAFRHLPDRRQLLRDLTRAARMPSTPGCGSSSSGGESTKAPPRSSHSGPSLSRSSTRPPSPTGPATPRAPRARRPSTSIGASVSKVPRVASSSGCSGFGVSGATRSTNFRRRARSWCSLRAGTNGGGGGAYGGGPGLGGVCGGRLAAAAAAEVALRRFAAAA